MLILKVVDRDMRSYGGFTWPESGPVEAPDWSPAAVCGGGLHGWANGEGSYIHTLNRPIVNRWLVVEVADSDVVSLEGGTKVKFPRGTVVFCGDKAGAVKYLIDNGALTEKSNPGMVCLSPDQCAEVARRSAKRAARYAEVAEYAEAAAEAARYAARYAEYAEYARYAAEYARYAAEYAAKAAEHARSAARYAEHVRYAVEYAEREAHRIDKLQVLGVVP
jgi:hypothetical protein